MLDSDRLGTLLAVDAVLTVLAGLLVYARPGLVTALVPDRDPVAALADATTASRLGAAVAVFGATKGLLYAVALVRYGSERPPDGDG
jgi:hypothetical protein